MSSGRIGQMVSEGLSIGLVIRLKFSQSALNVSRREVVTGIRYRNGTRVMSVRRVVDMSVELSLSRHIHRKARVGISTRQNTARWS